MTTNISDQNKLKNMSSNEKHNMTSFNSIELKFEDNVHNTPIYIVYQNQVHLRLNGAGILAQK